MTYPPKKEELPGEWQRDEHGKKYRMIGHVKEYEPTVMIDGIEVYASELEEFNARRRAATNARIEAEKHAAATAPARRSCPFLDGLNTDCMRDNCAFYVAGSCTFARIAERPATDTQGKKCALNRYNKLCNADCALYKNGCILTGLIMKER